MSGATMRDIAKKVGVSEATVSLVINGHRGRVSAQTRAQVLAAIQELDYTPNTIARSLAARATWTFGLVVADVVRQPFSLAIQGVEAAAMRQGYNVILCNADYDDERLVQATNVLLAKRVDGMVFVLSSRLQPNLPLQRLAGKHIPVVMVNYPGVAPGVPAVLIDNASGISALTQQLIDLGHRHIACIHLPISGPRSVMAAQERYTGFCRTMAANALPVPPEYLKEGAQGEYAGETTGYRMTQELLRLPHRPTALVCCNDYLAIGAMQACNAAGLSIPADIAVVGHDNIPAARYLRPALTTVNQPMREAGEQATQLLLQQIWQKSQKKGPGPESAMSTRLPCTPVIRASAGHRQIEQSAD